MAKRGRPAAWDSDEVLNVAEMYYRQNMTLDKIAKLRLLSRQTAGRMLQVAKDSGMVQIIITSPVDPGGADRTAEMLKTAYPCLKEVVLVPGHPDLEKPDPSTAVQDGIVTVLAAETARYLTRTVIDGDIIAIGSGDLLRRTVSMSRFDRPFPSLTVVPMQGYFRVTSLPTDANSIAAELATRCGGTHKRLAVPGLVPSEVGDIVANLPTVRRTLRMIGKVNLVLTGVGLPSSRNTRRLISSGVANKVQVRAVLAQQPVAEICGRLLAADGSSVRCPWRVIGLGADRMRQMVELDAAKAILVAGADLTRSSAVVSVLRGRYVNMLITDHIMARSLLGQRSV